MTKRALNLYELIFGAFFILKITATGVVANWNWFFVFLPLIIEIIHHFFVWVYEGTGMNKRMKIDLRDAYLDNLRKRVSKKALKDLQKPK